MRVSRGAPVCTVWKPGPWGIMERQIKVSAARRLLQAGGNCSCPLSPGLAMPAGRLSSKQLGDAWWWWSLPVRMQHHLYTSLEDKPAQRNPISQCKVLRHCSWALDASTYFYPLKNRRKGFLGTACCRSAHTTCARGSRRLEAGPASTKLVYLLYPSRHRWGTALLKTTTWKRYYCS